MDSTPSSFVWYFPQKSSQTQTRRSLPGDGVRGQTPPERRGGLCRGGRSRAMQRCPQNPSFPASGFRAGSPGCARHRDGLSSKIPGRAPSASPPALLGFSVCQSGCICHLTVELVGKAPCSYRDWAVKSSISVDIFASASEFFSWLAVGMSQGAGNDWSCSPNTWHCT